MPALIRDTDRFAHWAPEPRPHIPKGYSTNEPVITTRILIDQRIADFIKNSALENKPKI